MVSSADEEEETLLELLQRVEREVAAQGGVFDDPGAYRAGVRDVCSRLVEEIERRREATLGGAHEHPTLLDDVLPRLVAELRTEAGHRPIELRLRRTPLSTTLDGAAVRYLVAQLVRSAVRRAPTDTPVVVAADGDGHRTLLAVEDGGPPAHPPVTAGSEASDESMAELRDLVSAHGGRLCDERLADPPRNCLRVELPAAGPASGPDHVIRVPDLQPGR